jgi:hypothetical protein
VNGAASTIELVNSTPTVAFADVPGLITPIVGGVALELNLNGSGGISDAGAYSGGVIRVTASAL